MGTLHMPRGMKMSQFGKKFNEKNDKVVVFLLLFAKIMGSVSNLN